MNKPIGQLHMEDQEEYEATMKKENLLKDGFITAKVDTKPLNLAKSLENWIIWGDKKGSKYENINTRN